jgi:hypothetical protein
MPKPRRGQLAIPKQHGGKKIVLASEIRIERPLGQGRPVGDAVDAGSGEP